jgi:hypothetical protein
MTVVVPGGELMVVVELELDSWVIVTVEDSAIDGVM